MAGIFLIVEWEYRWLALYKKDMLECICRRDVRRDHDPMTVWWCGYGAWSFWCNHVHLRTTADCLRPGFVNGADNPVLRHFRYALVGKWR
jgi:hypothetical protein